MVPMDRLCIAYSKISSTSLSKIPVNIAPQTCNCMQKNHCFHGYSTTIDLTPPFIQPASTAHTHITAPTVLSHLPLANTFPTTSSLSAQLFCSSWPWAFLSIMHRLGAHQDLAFPPSDHGIGQHWIWDWDEGVGEKSRKYHRWFSECLFFCMLMMDGLVG